MMQLQLQEISYVGYLVNRDLSYDIYHTKQDIAQAIKEKVMQL